MTVWKRGLAPRLTLFLIAAIFDREGAKNGAQLIFKISPPTVRSCIVQGVPPGGAALGHSASHGSQKN
jgi:hypothetical protein